jgi:Flp pilus assembly protein TadD
MTLQERYDDGMFDFSQGEFDSAIGKFESILKEEPNNFDAQLALGMAHYRKGDFARAIEEGHKAERLKPHEQLVHTNLSLFYMKSGDKKTAEHHGLQARIAGWRTEAAEQTAGVVSGTGAGSPDPELALARPPAAAPLKLPDMPWKKKKEHG